MSMRTKEEQALRAANANIHTCTMAGPWGALCTDDAGHDYSCYDSGLDVSFNRRWMEDMDVPVENHPYDCRCEECRS